MSGIILKGYDGAWDFTSVTEVQPTFRGSFQENTYGFERAVMPNKWWVATKNNGDWLEVKRRQLDLGRIKKTFDEHGSCWKTNMNFFS